MKKWLLLTLFTARLGAATPALAESSPPGGTPVAAPDAELKRLMARGAAEYEKEHWDGARQAFLDAWRIRRHYAVAANLGDVETRLGLFRDAAQHLEYSLSNLPSDRADRRAELEKLLAQASAHLERVTVTVDVSGATLRVDGAAVGSVPLSGSVWLEPGSHSLAVESPGYATETRDLVAKPGGTTALTLTLKPVERAAPAPAPAAASGEPAPPSPERTPASADAAPRERGGSAMRTVVIAGTGILSVAAVVTGVVFRVKAGHADDDAAGLQTHLANYACSGAAAPPECGTLKARLSDAADDKNLSTVAFVTGGVLAATTVSLLLLWPAHAATPSSSSASAISPWVVPGEGAGATYRLRF